MSLSLTKKLRKKNFKTVCIVKTWEELFRVKVVLKILLPMLHIFDIIHLMQTTREIYIFYNNTKTAKILCPVVQRDLGESYKSPPLQFVSKNRTPKFEENRWVASKCSLCCNKTSSRPYRYVERFIRSVCQDCSILSTYGRLYVDTITRKYDESNKKRITKIVMRNSKKIYRMMKHEKQDQNQIEIFLTKEVSCLDLFIPIPIIRIKLTSLKNSIDLDWDLSYPFIDFLEEDLNPLKRNREDWEISL